MTLWEPKSHTVNPVRDTVFRVKSFVCTLRKLSGFDVAHTVDRV